MNDERERVEIAFGKILQQDKDLEDVEKQYLLELISPPSIDLTERLFHTLALAIKLENMLMGASVSYSLDFEILFDEARKKNIPQGKWGIFLRKGWILSRYFVFNEQKSRRPRRKKRCTMN